MKFEYDIEDVMKYFYEISAIPRMSGKEENIANYIEQFAKERNLQYLRDAYNNIIITKNASKYNKSTESVILQSHLDMVCEKEIGYIHDFEKEGLELYIDGDFIKAKGTTLGADNGIGVAIMLSILDSNEINHPRIEAIFTVQEETTMQGAKEIDTSSLKGNRMICLDNMNEEELWIGCAGAKIFEYKIGGNTKDEIKDYELIEISMSGFLGGHSGKDISKRRGNPIKQMAELLNILNHKYEILLKDISGGRKVNVIPRECYSRIYVRNKDLKEITKEVMRFETVLKELFLNKEISIICNKINVTSKKCFTEDTTKKVIDIISKIPNGVYHKDKHNNPLVSLNIGKICVDSDWINLCFSIRSNRASIENELINELKYLEKEYNIKQSVSELAGYEHKERSEFIDKCKEVYKAYFMKKPKVIDMHVCLEAGFFGEKMPNLDFVAIAPNIYDAHSPNERCSISSLKKIYDYILAILDVI